MAPQGKAMPAKTGWSAALAISAALTMVLAGCTGSFNVKQTEPIRVQIDGTSQTAKVDQSDAQPQKFVVENTAKVESIEVKVDVKQVSETPVTVMVTVVDQATNETLATKEVAVGGSSSSSASSMTGSPSASSSQGQTVTQNIVVNVKGKDNVVVITEAQQGTAEVNVAAREAGATQGTTVSGSATTTTTYA
jgi:hypothetical protein